MKSFEEIKKCDRLIIMNVTDDGGCGEIHMPTWKGSVIWSIGGGWDHVSVAPYKNRITPEWDDMCRLKDIFFQEDECVVQYHPAKSEYVSIVGNCLHLWRPQNEELPKPPVIFV